MADRAERHLGKRDGLRYAITWLHRRAEAMNDPHAVAILNSAAFALGLEIREGHTPPIAYSDTEPSSYEKALREIAAMDWGWAGGGSDLRYAGHAGQLARKALGLPQHPEPYSKPEDNWRPRF